MTRAEIEALSGRELDVAVAEALRFRPPGFRDNRRERVYLRRLDSGEMDVEHVDMATRSVTHWTWPPAYSTTWQGMGLVIGAMGAKGYQWETWGPSQPGAKMHRNGNEWLAWGDAPAAVARAALLAVSEERE